MTSSSSASRSCRLPTPSIDWRCGHEILVLLMRVRHRANRGRTDIEQSDRNADDRILHAASMTRSRFQFQGNSSAIRRAG